MADEADCSIVLALVQVGFVGKCDDQGLGGHSSVCQILLQTAMSVAVIASQHAWTSSAGMLSTPTDFHFFSDCPAASTSL